MNTKQKIRTLIIILPTVAIYAFIGWLMYYICCHSASLIDGPASVLLLILGLVLVAFVGRVAYSIWRRMVWYPFKRDVLGQTLKDHEADDLEDNH